MWRQADSFHHPPLDFPATRSHLARVSSNLAVTSRRTKTPDAFQRLLIESPSTIGLRALEPCCGHRRAWHRDKPSRTTFGDVAIGVRPEIVMDFARLPFRDRAFDLVFFDPPHLIRSEKWNQLSDRYLHFGHWETRAQWEAALDAVNDEFHRVTRGAARLFVKIIDGPDRRVTKLADLDRLTRWRRIEISLKPSPIPWSRCQTVSATFERTP